MLAPMDPFWGDRTRLPDLERIACKGNWIAARRAYALQRWGPSMTQAIADELSARDRRLFEGPLMPFSWQPMAVLCAIDESIYRLGMHGVIAPMRDFGRAIANADLNRLYRAFMSLGTPALFLNKSHLIFGQYVRAGTMRATTTPTSAEICLEDLVVPLYLCEYGIPGFIHEAVEATGGKQVVIRHPECAHRGAPACRYRVEWR